MRWQMHLYTSAMLRLTFPLSLLTLLSPIYAQFPPVPKDITTIECQSYPGVSITYKEVCLPLIVSHNG